MARSIDITIYNASRGGILDLLSRHGVHNLFNQQLEGGVLVVCQSATQVSGVTKALDESGYHYTIDR